MDIQLIIIFILGIAAFIFLLFAIIKYTIIHTRLNKKFNSNNTISEEFNNVKNTKEEPKLITSWLMRGKIKRYIEDCKRLGYSEEQINDALEKAGYMTGTNKY